MIRTTISAGLCVLLAGTSLARANPPVPLAEPLLPQPIPISVTVDLLDFATLPRHADGSAARPQALVPAADGSTDLFVIDEAGLVYRVSADGTRIVPYLDLRSQNVGFLDLGGELGLVGLAFHPNFAGNPSLPGYGKLYTAYSATRTSGTADFLANDDADHHQVIREWTAYDPRALTFAGTTREVLRVGKYANNHNGGDIGFNPNAAPGTADYGALYIGFGDGGGGNDPRGNGQNLASPLGKILRINPLAGPNAAKWTIPSDNPFQSHPLAGPLIWAYGLRNPQQFSWETGGAGRMAIADIGQNQVEEVDVGFIGANYGWQQREGTFATGAAVGSAGGKNDYADYPLPANDAANGYTYPAVVYDHSDAAQDGGTVGAAIGRGFIYHGTAVPALRGGYIFTDFVRGLLLGIDTNAPLPLPLPVLQGTMVYKGVSYQSLNASPIGEGGRSDLRLGQDAKFELYAMLKGPGAIYRIAPYQ